MRESMVTRRDFIAYLLVLLQNRERNRNLKLAHVGVRFTFLPNPRLFQLTAHRQFLDNFIAAPVLHKNNLGHF